MATKTFVNLPVRDLDRATAFFRALGFTFDPDYTDAKAACMVIGAHSYAMLLTEPFFATFTDKPTADASESTEVIVAVLQDTREDVDRIGDAALAAGAAPARRTAEESPMYTRSFYDLDGHHWEFFAAGPAS
ncbi:VOC family protein [Actinacidiphila yeochonensis]|uniref:VOC family protein n=1 Tax=Actinacidiphila yeochonensis TaxID=89050 RepID=UPI000564E49B|nr:VOC family protein [Actinacidiphila yeochonensis]